MKINYGSGGYSIIDHAIWNGLHLADTVFPCFIFLMGTSIPLSFNDLFKKNQTNLKKKDIFLKIIKRSFLLFVFGLLTSNSSKVTLRELRIFGVRFANELTCLKLN
jgi:heparan-alpha-glucosaminide N-acetyltransferase